MEVATIYLTRRNADLVELGPAPSLLRNVDAQRNVTASASVDPSRAVPEGWFRAFDPVTLAYSSGVTSRFDREAVEPGLIHELAWGRREHFLTIGSDTASTLSERDRLTVRGGVRLRRRRRSASATTAR